MSKSRSKPKEDVIVFKGEEDFLLPRNRTYDLEKGVSHFVGGDGTTGPNGPCVSYVIQSNSKDPSTWSGILCTGEPTTGSISADGIGTTPCLQAGSLEFSGTDRPTITTSICKGIDAATTTTTTTSTTTTTTTVAPVKVDDKTTATVTLPAGTTIGIPPTSGIGGGGGGGSKESKAADKKINWLLILGVATAIYILFKKKK